MVSQFAYQRWGYDSNYTDRAKLTMKVFTEDELERYLSKISDEALYSYNVYQIEGEEEPYFLKFGDENIIGGPSY